MTSLSSPACRQVQASKARLLPQNSRVFCLFVCLFVFVFVCLLLFLFFGTILLLTIAHKDQKEKMIKYLAV